MCRLLTPAEIEAATGVPPGEPSSTVSDACTWGAADGGNPRLVTLTARRATLTREQWLEAGGSEADVVPGVGDLAVRVGSQLQVYQRGWQVAVAVRGSERENAAQELALAAHARLAV